MDGPSIYRARVLLLGTVLVILAASVAANKFLGAAQPQPPVRSL